MKNELEKLASERKEWLNKGTEEVLSLEDKPLVYTNLVDRMILVLSNTQVYDKVKILSFKAPNGKSLPIFRAGQYIAITIKVGKKYKTESYALISSAAAALKGIYSIAVVVDNNEVTDYLFNRLQIGEKIVSSFPYGDFYYDPLRDQENVIGITAGKGIFPLMGMIQSIIDGVDKYNLTIFYNEARERNLYLKEKLDELDRYTSKVRVIYVLSEEDKEGYLKGFVSLDKIKAVMKEDNSFFISGAEVLLKYIESELESLKLPRKFIKYQSFLPTYNIKSEQEFKLTIYINNEKYETKCYNNKTIMDAILDLGIFIPSKCHNGTCLLCSSELVKGKVKVFNDKRKETEKKYNYIHPCVTYPLSDIEIIIR